MTREEAIKVANEMYGWVKTDREKEALETLVPELAESEDKRIRKFIYDYIANSYWMKDWNVSQKECLAYLEKQKEQKSLNISAASEWLRKHVCNYISSEYNEFHKCVEYDGSIDKEKLINDFEKAMQKEPEDKGEISDGCHTFNELYYYRMLYNAAFFNLLPKEWAHKSKKHHDGEECFGGGWFIVMANLPTGQISNHYELKDWDLFQIPEKEIADEWDGHTPQEAAERLHKYLQEKQKEEKPINESNMHELTFDEARKWNEAYEKGYSLGYENGRNEQKPAEWSKEDDFKLGALITDIETRSDLTEAIKIKYVSFLKSLRPQPKKEWSKEDEAHRKFILESLEDQIRFCKKDAEGAYYTKQIRTAQNWLNDLPNKFNTD